MVKRPLPVAVLRAYKASLAKLDAQMRELLADANGKELRDSLWLHEEFVMPRDTRLSMSLRVTVEMPAEPAPPLMIAGPKP